MDLLAKLDVPFQFRRRPAPVPADLRPVWRIGLLLLMLLHSPGKKATLQKLHFVNSVCRSEKTRRLFLAYSSGAARKEEVLPRIEPSLNRAVNFARAEGLVDVENGRSLKLTDSGRELAQQIEAMPDCLDEEKAFLETASPFLTEGKVEDLFTWNINL